MLHLGNSAEVDKEKMRNFLREAELDRLAQQVGDKESTMLQSVGSRLLEVFTKTRSTHHDKQDGECVCLAKESV